MGTLAKKASTQLPSDLPMAHPEHRGCQKRDDINPFHPLHTPVSQTALAPIPSASGLTDTQANAPPPQAPVENER